MNPLVRAVLLALLVPGLTAVPAFAALPGIPPAPGAITHTATAAGGNWNTASTWTNLQVPVDNAIVKIPAGSTVTVAGDTRRLRWVQVDGTLALHPGSNSRLFVDTIYVSANGLFTLATPLPSTAKAEVIFTSYGPISTSWDPEQMSRGLIAEGRVKIYGFAKQYMRAVIADARKGTTSVTLGNPPTGWANGDEVVLTGTYFRRNAPLQDERVTITGISGNTITFWPPLAYDHLRVSTTNASNAVITPFIHMANLTRNVIFRSENPIALDFHDRGHVILMHADSDIQNVAFNNLGRTNKARPLDDVKVVRDLSGTPTGLSKPDVTQIFNRRGRYSVHVHETRDNPASAPYHPVPPPATPPTKIVGCVANNTPGWAFANHSSHVDFRNNVAYDFTGAGFVTEDGDELGNFTNNIAIRGRGEGNGKYYKDRINFNNQSRPQAIADFAFDGGGFWFNGPAVRVSGAIANSCHGTGVTWHTTGAVDFKKSKEWDPTNYSNYPFGQYSFFPSAWLSGVYGGFPGFSGFKARTWDAGTGQLVISDLPILQFDNVDSYANFVAMRLRFNNFDNIDWYNESTYDYDLHIQAVPGYDKRTLPVRLRQTINSARLWNSESATELRYAGWTDWNNTTAISRLDHDGPAPTNNPGININHGAEMFFRLASMTFTTLTIDGWELAGYIANANNNAINDITFTPGTKKYSNYAHPDTRKMTCATPANLSATAGASPTVSWSSSAGATRYLVRYRPKDAQGQWEQQWRFAQVNTTATSVPVSGLTPGRMAQYQVAAGCTDGLSNWTPAFERTQ